MRRIIIGAAPRVAITGPAAPPAALPGDGAILRAARILEETVHDVAR